MLVSIIMPVYNAEKFLCNSLNSAVAQTYSNIEIILVIDGSTDGSGKICRSFAEKDNRIKIITQENKGPAAARNAGVKIARGDFIFFLDSDDLIKEDTIKILIDEYKKSKSDLILSNFCKLTGNSEIVDQQIAFSPENKLFTNKRKKLLNDDIVNFVRHFLNYPSNHLVSYCWARLYKTSIIKQNSISANEKMRLFEDLVFNLEYLKYVNEVTFINQPLYIYVMHQSHISASMSIINAESLLHDMNIFKIVIREFILQKSDFPGIEKEIGHALIHYTIIFLIRSCRQLNISNKKLIKNEIRKMLKSPIIRESLKYYSPKKGNSRVLPFFMKHKLLFLLMLIAKFKANRRYGRLRKC